MTNDRRFDDQEIKQILELATREHPSRAPLASGEGMTLTELTRIGAEVGIPAERMSAAALAVQSGAPAHVSGSFLGAPDTVTRKVELQHAMTDDQWARLVSDLRRTFAAQGKLEVHGGLRSWANGNLQVLVEPAATGSVIRMSTRNGQSRQFGLMSAMAVVMGAVVAAGALLGSGDDTLAKSLIFFALALGPIGWARFSLPGWARTRAEQMDAVAERVLDDAV